MIKQTYIPKDPQYKQKVLDSFLRQEFMAHIGAQLVEVKPGYCEIHLPYKKEQSLFWGRSLLAHEH